MATFLARHGLTRYLPVVVGRHATDPALLKPAPYLVHQALDALQVSPSRAAFVGDSTSDIAAATRAHGSAVGYANKPGKRDRLRAAGAHSIIDSITELAPLRVAS